MNQTTVDKISSNQMYLLKMAVFLMDNPDKEWMFDLLDEPYKLAIRIIEMNERNPERLARQLGINRNTARTMLVALGVNPT